MNNFIKITADKIKELFDNEPTGHDWWHIYRVWQTAKFIAEQEMADSEIVEMAALLHDISDQKFNSGDTDTTNKVIADFLSKIDYPDNKICVIQEIVEKVSFKGSGVEDADVSLEGQIVRDADRLDAIGAIGIARAFAYGGNKSRQIYNPEIKPQLHKNFEEYKSSTGTTINHFYEKLLFIKDRIKTPTAKLIAEKRHELMLQFLDSFFKEWNLEEFKNNS